MLTRTVLGLRRLARVSYSTQSAPRISHHPSASLIWYVASLLFWSEVLTDHFVKSEIHAVTIEDSNEFFFKAHGHKHSFKAANQEERKAWVVAIEKKAAEAKAMKDEILNSEGYKKHLETFSKFSFPMPS